MEALATLAGERRFLMVGDSKVVSHPNLRAMIEANVTFISPASKSYVDADMLARCDHDSAFPVGYTALCDANKSIEERGSYRVLEDTMVIGGKKSSIPICAYVGCLCTPAPGPAQHKKPGRRS